MSDLLTITETEVRLTIGDLAEWEQSPQHMRARLDLCEWITFHGGDPHDTPVHNTITRDVEGRCVRLTMYRCDETGTWEVELDEHGEYHVVTHQVRLQGETPPLPWPDSIRALGRLDEPVECAGSQADLQAN